MASLMFKITNDEAEDIKSVRPKISDELSSIIKKSLAKNAEDRFQTGTGMANRLKTLLTQTIRIDELTK